MTDQFFNGQIPEEENIEAAKEAEENSPAYEEAVEDILVQEEVVEEIPIFAEEKTAPVFVESAPAAPQKKKGNIGLWVAVAFCLVFSFASFAISGVSFILDNIPAISDEVEEEVSENPTDTDNFELAVGESTDKLTVAGVTEKVKKSVVLIETQISTAYTSGTGMGSGFIITEDGIIVTNHHVIEDAQSITVTTDDKKTYTATLLGSDSTTDIAVLKIEGSGFTPAEIGDSSKTNVGDQVVAIGTPYSSTLMNTVTSGYVSAIRDDYRFSDLSMVLSVIQHDAAINSGNSGGPLCNMYGQIIGINTVKIAETSYENIGFAIQISKVSEIISELIQNGSIDRPMIGISAQTNTNIGGAVVAQIAKGSPAEKAGLQVGDIITKVDGIRVTSTEELINYLSQRKVGDTVNIIALRDAESVSLEMTLISTEEYNSLQPAEDESQNQNQNSQPNYSGSQNPFEDFFNEYFGY